ncbi:L-histidine N(alpha)-methyltransferase [Sinobaca sp. H24]|uniref:L-histidine N(alpha)-methyltransferase n=1 Tax=Sinobaca sp. H24 TaxID=2923376 RepID=UPI00207983D5|nr:L-histidine N(alpha)-methyltransferase [Sinobaca sp. H24]
MKKTNLPYTLVDLQPDVSSFKEDVIAGFEKTHKALPAKHFYDKTGSSLFNAITKLPEYYVSRTEMDILHDFGPDIAEAIGGRAHIIELGSGSFDKINQVLPFLKSPASYKPVDISISALQDTAERVLERYPDLEVTGICADYTSTLDFLHQDRGNNKTICFLGSTIGNFQKEEAAAFLQSLAGELHDDGQILIGVDLKKDTAVLHNAYNDPAGITAAFNLNILERMNKEMKADIDSAGFTHHAFYSEENGRIEMHLQSSKEQLVSLEEHTFHFSKGETIHTENSHKFSIAEFIALAKQSHLNVDAFWTDEKEWFGVFLLKRP